MAAWQVRPLPMTIAAARRIVGTQSGDVIGATRISPAWSSAPTSGVGSTRTIPLATPGEGVPRVVMGRVCTR